MFVFDSAYKSSIFSQLFVIYVTHARYYKNSV